MFNLPSTARIFVYARPADMRCSFSWIVCLGAQSAKPRPIFWVSFFVWQQTW